MASNRIDRLRAEYARYAEKTAPETLTETELETAIADAITAKRAEYAALDELSARRY